VRIGVNTLQVQPGRATSNRIYLKSLLSAISELDRENEYLVFVSRGTAGTFETGRPNVREVICPLTHLNTGVRILWEQFLFPGFLRKHGVDVLYSPDNSGPVRPGCRSVLTIQMVQAYLTPHCYTAFRRAYHHWVTRTVALGADRVVCVSDNLRRNIAMYMDLPSEKLVVVPEAASEHFQPVPREKAVAEAQGTYGLPTPYILNVANVIPYKNTLRLVEAFALLREAGYPHHLVIVGGERWPFGYAKQVEAALDRHGIRPFVKFVGHLPHEALPAIYSAAELLCFPSTCETWGLPVVEALACGCPVVTSDWSSLPEVAGDAAELVDPFVPADIARGLRKVLDSPEYRQQIVERGFRRSQELSWKHSAELMIGVFGSLGR
jgi:glycosyltransferase involved in cell wall biosynthesis